MAHGVHARRAVITAGTNIPIIWLAVLLRVGYMMVPLPVGLLTPLSDGSTHCMVDADGRAR